MLFEVALDPKAMGCISSLKLTEISSSQTSQQLDFEEAGYLHF